MTDETVQLEAHKGWTLLYDLGRNENVVEVERKTGTETYRGDAAKIFKLRSMGMNLNQASARVREEKRQANNEHPTQDPFKELQQRGVAAFAEMLVCLEDLTEFDMSGQRVTVTTVSSIANAMNKVVESVVETMREHEKVDTHEGDDIVRLREFLAFMLAEIGTEAFRDLRE